MEVFNLASLKRFVGSKEQQAAAELRHHEGPQVPSFDPRCKLFEIAQCGESKVILADQEGPGIWLYHPGKSQWHYLADSFTKYFRMMLVHLGLPLWQYCVTGIPLPTWVEQVFFLVGPHLLPKTAKPKESVSMTLWNEGPTNTIDPTIFKSRDKQQRSLKKK